MSVSSTTVAAYWNWTFGLTTGQLGLPGGVIYHDPSSGYACLMDPTIAFHYPANSTQTTNGGLGSSQDVIIPLFIAIAEDNSGTTCPNCNQPIGSSVNQLILTANEKYFVGHITSQVKINGTDVIPPGGGGVPYLDVDMCLCQGTTTVRSTPHGQTTPTEVNALLFTSSTVFSISVPPNSVYKWDAGPPGGTSTIKSGPHNRCVSIGYWTVISPPAGGWKAGKHTIEYTTTWVKNSIGLSCTCTEVEYKDYMPAPGVTVTYQVT
jgi:hypothetical protein